jgi:hypothetical protein
MVKTVVTAFTSRTPDRNIHGSQSSETAARPSASCGPQNMKEPLK